MAPLVHLFRWHRWDTISFVSSIWGVVLSLCFYTHEEVCLHVSRHCYCTVWRCNCCLALSPIHYWTAFKFILPLMLNMWHTCQHVSTSIMSFNTVPCFQTCMKLIWMQPPWHTLLYKNKSYFLCLQHAKEFKALQCCTKPPCI